MKSKTVRIALVAAIVLGILIFGLAKVDWIGKENVGREEISLRLKWFVYSSFAHHFVAKEKGLYASQGLNVSIEPGGTSIDPIRAVALGEDDVGLASYAQILLARQQGFPVVAIAEEYVKSGVVAISLKDSGITRPQDFIGKRVGMISGSDTGTVYEALMESEDIDRSAITEVGIGYDLTPLLTGQIDVSTVAYITNQPIVATLKGYPVNIIDPHEYGIRPGGNVVFTTEEVLRNKRNQLKKFLRAMVDGIILSQKMPDEEVVEIVLKYNDKLDRDTEIEIWKATKDQLLSDDPARVGIMPRDTWEQTAIIFNRFGALEDVPPLEKCYTNKLIEEVLQEREASN